VVGGLSKKRKDGLCAVHCDNFFHKALIYGAKIVWFLKIIFPKCLISSINTQDNNPSRIDDGCGCKQSACAETYGDGGNEQCKRCFARVRV